ncbi:MAG: hypothetical protein H5T86_12255 [Armatimonadetes bacterium]|nr:hypothetical protein [Armatimonadota bacterium]
MSTRFARDARGQIIPGGIWCSDDAGHTWQRVGDLPEWPRVAIAPSNPEIIYAGERDYSSVGRGGVWRSDDGGKTWRLLAERLDVGFGNIKRTYIGALAVDPAAPMLRMHPRSMKTAISAVARGFSLPAMAAGLGSPSTMA